MALDDLRRSPMMAHLLDALDEGTDIGHYGRLVVAMVGRWFLDPEELAALLARDRDCSEEQAKALVHQAITKGYSPPRRERILEWQGQQRFPICPAPDDPDACNVYSELDFPDEVYDGITEYHADKLDAGDGPGDGGDGGTRS